MASAAFLAQVATLPPSDLGGGAAAAAPGSVAVSMTCQEEDLWCWAAVTQSVEGWKGKSLDQSHIASHHVGAGAVPLACVHPLSTGDSGTTCNGCGGKGCSDPHRLSAVLTERARLGANGSVHGLATFQDIKDAIDAGRPLPIRINWNGTDAHFICVIGYFHDGEGAEWLQILDPLLPGVAAGPADEQSMRYAIFSTAYPSSAGGTGTPDFKYELS